MENHETVLDRLRAHLEDVGQIVAQELTTEGDKITRVLEAYINSIVPVFGYAHYTIKLREARLKQDSHLANKAIAQLLAHKDPDASAANESADEEEKKLEHSIMLLEDEQSDHMIDAEKAVGVLLSDHDAASFIRERALKVVRGIFDILERPLPPDTFDRLFEFLREANEDHGFARDEQAVEQEGAQETQGDQSTAAENDEADWVSLEDSEDDDSIFL